MQRVLSSSTTAQHRLSWPRVSGARRRTRRASSGEKACSHLLVSSGEPAGGAHGMATSKRPTSLLIRLDPRQRGGLQRQIYASIQRAILDGVLGPGTRLPSSRALADDLGVSRTTTLLAVQQLQAEGYLTGAPRLRHLRGRRAAGRSACAGATARPRRAAEASAPLAPRGRAGGGAPGRPPARGPAARLPHRHPRGRSLPGARSGRGSRAGGCASITPAQLDYGDAGRPSRAARGHRRPRAGRARAPAVSADQVLIVAGAQQGLELISRVLLDPGDRVWMEEPGYPGRAQRAARRGRADRPGPGGRRGPRRRDGRPRGGRCAAGLRDAVAPVSRWACP